MVLVSYTLPTNQDGVFPASSTYQGGTAVLIQSSGNTNNQVWFAPAGTPTASLSVGPTMTKATNGLATTILAPTTAATYKLFLVDANGTGVTRRGYPTQDGLRAAEITLAGAKAVAVGDPGSALPMIEHVVDRAIAALCAEAVGAMEVMQEITLDYIKTRKQFGRAIGEFQVIQHRSVDMLVALEQARSMALFATVMADESDPMERARAISAAKVQIGRSARHVGQECIQLHGGIAMTNEYKAGHYFKRATMIDKLYGDADHHLTALARLGGLFGRAA